MVNIIMIDLTNSHTHPMPMLTPASAKGYNERPKNSVPFAPGCGPLPDRKRLVGGVLRRGLLLALSWPMGGFFFVLLAE